jgi:hypothetical protein
MTGPNTIKPAEPASTAEPSIAEAAGALAMRATEPDTTALREDTQAVTEPARPSGEQKVVIRSWSAMEGPHPNWLGFSAITGEPKVKR